MSRPQHPSVQSLSLPLCVVHSLLSSPVLSLARRSLFSSPCPETVPFGVNLAVAVSPLKSDWVDAVDGPGTLEAHTHHAHSHITMDTTCAVQQQLSSHHSLLSRHLKGGSAIATMAPTIMPN
ncbi:hypothetical protein CGGC5_v005586 [Colletotrichum fructicola Nara gc5]|uniref:Uncharacterized protein n=1 Tax=Colletotrichum fructicola (strain Nara gc5) TaxID=1213859 RepID=A0A7J6J9L3_COLFN|nr:hypothetical protein CGGC5_v005586 [Colletotrichum fructicola Nara gc5]